MLLVGVFGWILVGYTTPGSLAEFASILVLALGLYAPLCFLIFRLDKKERIERKANMPYVRAKGTDIIASNKDPEEALKKLQEAGWLPPEKV